VQRALDYCSRGFYLAGVNPQVSAAPRVLRSFAVLCGAQHIRSLALILGMKKLLYIFLVRTRTSQMNSWVCRTVMNALHHCIYLTMTLEDMLVYLDKDLDYWDNQLICLLSSTIEYKLIKLCEDVLRSHVVNWLCCNPSSFVG
jgi:hypothetical protein